MSYYVIGIGGTGAKCVESLTHLCAAGAMPDGDLYVLFVDPDKSNGSLDRAEVTLKNYVDCENLQLGAIDLFKTKIKIADPDVWSPFKERGERTLEGLFRYPNLDATSKSLFDVLYSPAEKSTKLDEGFRGHPSIGAAVMAHTVELGADEPWTTFRERIALDIGAQGGAQIILIGSIFGGTGASGLPTIARLIRNELKKIGQKNASIGVVILLPYFSFTPVKTDQLKVDAENFLLNTQAALNYYYQQKDEGVFDAVYLLGEDQLSPMSSSSVGGQTQNNEPHITEFYAALACIDFFNNIDFNQPTKYFMTARNQAKTVRWNDIPYQPDAKTLQLRIEQLTQFAFAFLHTYYPMLKDIKEHSKEYRAPWYIDLFLPSKIDLAEAIDHELLDLKKYCERYLEWVGNLQTSANEIKVELFYYDAFTTQGGDNGQIQLREPADFTAENFSNLTLRKPGTHENGLTRLWERICETQVKDNNAHGIGKFVHALYSECKVES